MTTRCSNNEVFVSWLRKYLSAPLKVAGVPLAALQKNMPSHVAEAMKPLGLCRALRTNSNEVATVGYSRIALAPEKMTKLIFHKLEKVAKKRGGTASHNISRKVPRKAQSTLEHMCGVELSWRRKDVGAVLAEEQRWNSRYTGFIAKRCRTSTQNRIPAKQGKIRRLLPGPLFDVEGPLPMQGLALDCEGVLAVPTYEVSLLQIASMTSVYVVDMLTHGHAFMEAGLRDLLEDNKVLKVLHDCRNDSRALWYQYGCYLNPIFDTQGIKRFLQSLH